MARTSHLSSRDERPRRPPGTDNRRSFMTRCGRAALCRVPPCLRTAGRVRPGGARLVGRLRRDGRPAAPRERAPRRTRRGGPPPPWRPAVPAPAQESPNAYLRRVEDVLYVCPWQSRLRSWLAFSRFRGATPPKLMDRFVPRRRRRADGRRLRPVQAPHRLGRAAHAHPRLTWHFRRSWFVPFDGNERWLVLGGARDPGRARPPRAT